MVFSRGVVSAALAVVLPLSLLLIAQQRRNAGRGDPLPPAQAPDCYLAGGAAAAAEPAEWEAFTLPFQPVEQLSADTLPLSSHNCTGDEVYLRVCRYTNLLLHNGEVFYVARGGASAQLPPLADVCYNQGRKEFQPKLLLRSNASSLGWDFSTAAALPRTWLWTFSNPAANFYHHMAEELITMHNTLCQALGLCRYEQRADPAQDLLILGLNGAVLSKPGQPKVLLARPANATIAQCITARPALLTKHHSLWGKVILLREAWAGIGPACRAMGCRASVTRQDRSPIPAAGLQRYRDRMAACYGVPLEQPASLHPLRILVIDRTYESGRHILNIRSVMQLVRQRFPADEVQLAYFEDLSFREQLQRMSWASIVLLMHGAALGLVPLMPPGAVFIHVMPDRDNHGAQAWAQFMVDDFSFLNISFVPLNNTDGALERLKLENVRQDEFFQELSPSDRLMVLEEGRCPRKKAYCKMFFFRKQVNLVLNLEDLGWALDTAVQQLRGAGRPGSGGDEQAATSLDRPAKTD